MPWNSLTMPLIIKYCDTCSMKCLLVNCQRNVHDTLESTAHSSYSQGIQDGWLACHSLAKSTKSLSLLHTPDIVTVFKMVGWPLLPLSHTSKKYETFTHRRGKSELFLEGEPGIPGELFLPFLSPPFILFSST